MRHRSPRQGKRVRSFLNDWLGRVYPGDCLRFIACLPDNSIDLVLCDPPYGLDRGNDDPARKPARTVRGRKGLAPRRIAGDSYMEWSANLPLWMTSFMRILKPGACCCCCCGGGGPHPVFAEMALVMDETIGFKQAVVWDKVHMGLGWHYRRTYDIVMIGQKRGAPSKWYGDRRERNLIRIPRVIPRSDQHPTPKPAELMQHFIRLHSRPGHVVFDPFLGGGTTAVVAEAMGRRWLGCEIDPRFVAMAEERISRARALRLDAER